MPEDDESKNLYNTVRSFSEIHTRKILTPEEEEEERIKIEQRVFGSPPERQTKKGQ